MGRHPRIPKGSSPNAALRSTNGNHGTNGKGHGKVLKMSNNGNHRRSNTASAGNNEIRPISDPGFDLYVTVASGQEEGIFIPGGRYEPGQFPALERTIAEWRQRFE